MVNGLFHPGSGLGNMLHRYVATRVLALDKGYDFGMIGADNFKGKSFMRLDMGFKNKALEGCKKVEQPAGKIVFPPFLNEMQQTIQPRVWEEKTNYYNPEFNFIEDNTIIDGEFQDERYFGHRLNEIDQWLTVEPFSIDEGATELRENKCVIGFRGGEFALFPELFLPMEYWKEAMVEMIALNPGMKFEVHTDDVSLASKYFHNMPIIHDVGINWRSMRQAKYAIIANSSFYILPRLLKHHESADTITIAPRYWARRNIKEWSMPQNFYRAFTYI